MDQESRFGNGLFRCSSQLSLGASSSLNIQEGEKREKLSFLRLVSNKTTPILRHEIAFQWFWVPYLVASRGTCGSLNFSFYGEI